MDDGPVLRPARTILRDGRWLVAFGLVLFGLSMAVSGLVAPTLEAGTATTDRTIVGIQGGGTQWMEHGRLRLYRGRAPIRTVGKADSYFDVTWLGDETVLTAYSNTQETACDRYDAPCARTGIRRVDLQTGTVTELYSYPVRTPTNSETHDVERIGEGRYLLTDMEHERLVIVSNGSVTWTWNARSVYEPPPDPTRRDWLHINDVDVIDEDRYLVSVRNANQLLVIERGGGVTDIINKDRNDRDDDSCSGPGQLVDRSGEGGVRCGDPTVMDHQHNPQWLGPGAVLVADSNNDRIVELHERNGTWEPVWTVSAVDGVPLDWPRDADRLPNGNTLITDTLNRRIVEVSPNGTVVWGVRTGLIPYEADRVPIGEPVGGPRNLDSNSAGGSGAPEGIVSTIRIGVLSIYPRLPFWYRGPQILLTVLSGVLVVGGIVRWIRSRRRSG